jgi:hypothetical protein
VAVNLALANDKNAVWVFQAASTLITGSGSSVVLQNGAQACNVFWQVRSSTNLGTGTTFVGTIMAEASITLNTAATLDGRALARNGAVNLQNSTITRSPCSTGVRQKEACRSRKCLIRRGSRARSRSATRAVLLRPRR